LRFSNRRTTLVFVIEAPVAYERHPGETGDPGVLAAVDQAEAELAELTGVLNATNARIAEVVAGLLANGGWCQSGIHSPEHYLGWKMGLSPAKARQYVAIAARIGELPHCAEAFEAGELSIDQAATVTAHAPAFTDEQVCGFAKLMTLRQLQQVLTRYAFEPPSAEAEPDEPAAEKREVRFGDDGQGRWRLNADLPADEGSFIEQALAACRDDLFHERFDIAEGDDGDDAPSAPTPSQVSWADALAEMAERASATGAQARPHADRYRVLFHHHVDPAGQPVMAAHGARTRLPDALRRYWTCDATAVPVNELQGVPVSVGRAQRIVPNRTRRLVEHRDGGCVVPGCSRRHYLVVHHIVHWADGGTTDTANLVSICPAHHRLVHRGELHITGNADGLLGLTITDRRGRLVTGAARAAPPGHPPLAGARAAGIHARTWHHPLGERLQYDNVYFNPPQSR
jgi:hypothetical protein